MSFSFIWMSSKSKQSSVEIQLLKELSNCLCDAGFQRLQEYQISRKSPAMFKNKQWIWILVLICCHYVPNFTYFSQQNICRFSLWHYWGNGTLLKRDTIPTFVILKEEFNILETNLPSCRQPDEKAQQVLLHDGPIKSHSPGSNSLLQSQFLLGPSTAAEVLQTIGSPTFQLPADWFWVRSPRVKSRCKWEITV